MEDDFKKPSGLEDTPNDPPPGLFFIEVMKNGSIVEQRQISKGQITFGRSKDCDFALEHPSISRNHAAIKWIGKDAETGYFLLQDQGSSHGTFLNKRRLKPGAAVSVAVNNNVVKFGGSTRSFILNSTDPTYGQEEQEERISGEDGGVQEDGDEDSEEEEDLEVLYDKITSFTKTPSAETKNEHVFKEAPNKCLQEWFDREGMDSEFHITHSNNNFRCNITVNIEGRDFQFEGDPHHKKKDAVNSTCLRICRVLDAFKRLFPWQKETHKRKRTNDEDDFDDEVLDETGEKKKIPKDSRLNSTETYDSLQEKWKDVSLKLSSLRADLVCLSSEKKKSQETPSDDDLDSFMNNLNSSGGKSGKDDKIRVSKIKLEIKELEKKMHVYELLMKASKPLNLPPTKIIIPETNSEKVTPIVQPSTGSIFEIPPSTSKQTDQEVPEVQAKPLISTQLGPPQPRKKVKPIRDVKDNQEDTANFVEWIPPSEQDGSGRTNLNDKLGY